MNNVQLIGRLTKDPDARYTNSQVAVTRFTLAVDRFSKGEKTADFIPITVFGKQAENCEKYLGKGNKVAVSGSIKTGSYEKEGHKVYTTEVFADRIEFLETKKAEDKAMPDSFAAIEGDIPF